MKYKVGDKVRYIGEKTEFSGRVGVIKKLDGSHVPADVHFLGADGGHWWSKLENLELIKEVTMEITKVYKVVHIDGDGGYSSVFCGQPCAKHTVDKNPKLSYRVGEVTVAPETSAGIYCQPDFDKAKRHADGTARLTIERPTAILEVEPTIIAGQRSGWEGKPMAVKVILEVWREEEPRPAPKFKVGDRVKTTYVEPFTITQALWADKNDEYNWSGHEHWHYAKAKEGGILGGFWYDEDMLELAPPKEEWVDVTKDCTVDLYHSDNEEQGSLIRLRHNGATVFEIGNEGEAWRRSGYKVETVRKSWKVSWFRVLKKVMK